MTSEQRKQALASRVEAAIKGGNPDLTTKGNSQKRKKCGVCGKSYLGRADSSACGDACRQKKSRG